MRNLLPSLALLCFACLLSNVAPTIAVASESAVLQQGKYPAVVSSNNNTQAMAFYDKILSMNPKTGMDVYVDAYTLDMEGNRYMGNEQTIILTAVWGIWNCAGDSLGKWAVDFAQVHDGTCFALVRKWVAATSQAEFDNLAYEANANDISNRPGVAIAAAKIAAAVRNKNGVATKNTEWPRVVPEEMKPVIGVPWGSAPEVAQAALKERHATFEMQPGINASESILVGGGGSFSEKEVDTWNFVYHNRALYQVTVIFSRTPHDGKSFVEFDEFKRQLTSLYGYCSWTAGTNAVHDYAYALSQPAYAQNVSTSNTISEFTTDLVLNRLHPFQAWIMGHDKSRLQIVMLSTNEVQLAYTSGTERAKIDAEKKAAAPKESKDL